MLRIPPIQSGFPGASGPTSAQTIGSNLGQSVGVSMGRTGGTIAGRSANVVSEVGQMLQSIGGGIENNKTLQMLIALMIFMALLQGAQGNQQQAQSGMELLSALGGGAGGSGEASMSLYVEQTNISISSTTLMASFGVGSAANGSLGQQFDAAI